MAWGVTTQKRLLPPAVLVLAFLLTALSVRVLDLVRPDTPRPRPRAVIETQIKIVEEQIAKAFPAVDRSSPPELAPPPPSHHLFFRQPTTAAPSATVAAIPSRAPPLL